MRKACALAVGLAAVFLTFPAFATNRACQNLQAKLPEYLNPYIERLNMHQNTTDNNLKITVQDNTDAYIEIGRVSDKYWKLLNVAIIDGDEYDPRMDHYCETLLYKANCEAFTIYAKYVISLPGMKREEIEQSRRQRCDIPK